MNLLNRFIYIKWIAGYVDGIKGGDEYLERLFTHLRWQWSVSRLVTWETYTQAASDRFRRLSLRVLAGTGPRFEIVPGPAVSFAVGLSYLFEHEALRTGSSFGDSGRSDFNHRLSLYYMGRFSVAPLITLASTTYYQPRLDAFVDDWRISSTLDLIVKLSEKLALKVGVSLYYDNEPPDDVKGLDTSTDVSVVFSL